MRSDVEFSQLRSFVVLGEELHFGKAAARLRVAQPGLSQQIRRLEERLGFKLFDRTSRTVTLTPAGSSFLANVRKLFIDLDRAVASGHDLASGRIGTVRVGYTALAMLTVLPPFVRRFRQRQPDVRVLLHELPSAAQLEGLRNGDLDAAILTGLPNDESIQHFQLWEDPFIVLLPENHAYAKKNTVSAVALEREQLIIFPRFQTPVLYDQILSLCRNSGFEPTIGQEAQSWHMIAELVSAGVGVAIAPLSVMRYRVSGLKYVALRPGGKVYTTLCFNRRGLSAGAKLFVETVKHFSNRAQSQS